MVLNKSTHEYGSALLSQKTNYCKTFEFNNLHGGDGPITCHLEEVNRDQTVTGLIEDLSSDLPP